MQTFINVFHGWKWSLCQYEDHQVGLISHRTFKHLINSLLSFFPTTAIIVFFLTQASSDQLRFTSSTVLLTLGPLLHPPGWSEQQPCSASSGILQKNNCETSSVPTAFFFFFFPTIANNASARGKQERVWEAQKHSGEKRWWRQTVRSETKRGWRKVGKTRMGSSAICYSLSINVCHTENQDHRMDVSSELSKMKSTNLHTLGAKSH